MGQEPHFISFDAPFADTTPGDYNGTFPASINASGFVTGYTNDANYVSHAFLRSPNGQIISFQAPGADINPADAQGTCATAINALGAITGYYGDSNGMSHGFLRSANGKFVTFDPAGSSATFPMGLNLEGAVVGFYTDANDVIHGFVRSPDGNIATFSGPNACNTSGAEGCFGTGAFNINVFGTVSGGFSNDNDGTFIHHGLLRSPQGKLTQYDDPNGGTGDYQGTGCPGCAVGLNDWGVAAGVYIDANSVQHGYVRSPDGKFTTYDAPGAGTTSYAGTGCSGDCPTSLNNFGAVTGTYIDNNFNYHGYLRNPAGIVSTIDPPGTIYTEPSAISDCGSITGTYIDANGVYHGFIALSQ